MKEYSARSEALRFVLERVVIYSIGSLLIGLILGGGIALFLKLFGASWDSAKTMFFVLVASVSSILILIVTLSGVHDAISVIRRDASTADIAELFVGEDHEEVGSDIILSADGNRRFRMTKTDAPSFDQAHYHLEVLDGEVVTKNYVVGSVDLRPEATGHEGRRFVTQLTEEPSISTQTIHFIGPPSELRNKREGPDPLPYPRFLLFEERVSGVFLFRFTRDRQYAGDTWHKGIEDAKRQAEYEYGDLLGELRTVPDEVKDVLAYAMNG